MYAQLWSHNVEDPANEKHIVKSCLIMNPKLREEESDIIVNACPHK